MAGYIVVRVEVTDPEKFAIYRDMVPPTLAKYGGRYLVRGGEWDLLEGEWNPQRLVIIEFETKEQAIAWWSSEEYAPAKKLRNESANSRLIAVDGFD